MNQPEKPTTFLPGELPESLSGPLETKHSWGKGTLTPGELKSLERQERGLVGENSYIGEAAVSANRINTSPTTDSEQQTPVKPIADDPNEGYNPAKHRLAIRDLENK